MTSCNSTIVINGGDTSLGRATALALATANPLHHIILAVDDRRNPEVQSVHDALWRVGPRSWEIIELDTTSFYAVASFADKLVQRVRSSELPPIQTLINAASRLSFKVEKPTSDGFDPVFQTNCLTPFLLTVSLLEAFDGMGRARVLNVASSGVGQGSFDYFDRPSSRMNGSSLSLREGMARYESSNLIMNASMYALRRSLVRDGIALNIATIETGRLSHDAHISSAAPASMRIMKSTLSSIGPLVRVFSKRVINEAQAAADIIAAAAVQSSLGGQRNQETYCILDEQVDLRTALRFTRDSRLMEKVLKKTMRDVEMDLIDCGTSTNPTLSSCRDSISMS